MADENGVQVGGSFLAGLLAGGISMGVYSGLFHDGPFDATLRGVIDARGHPKTVIAGVCQLLRDAAVGHGRWLWLSRSKATAGVIRVVDAYLRAETIDGATGRNIIDVAEANKNRRAVDRYLLNAAVSLEEAVIAAAERGTTTTISRHLGRALSGIADAQAAAFEEYLQDMLPDALGVTRVEAAGVALGRLPLAAARRAVIEIETATGHHAELPEMPDNHAGVMRRGRAAISKCVRTRAGRKMLLKVLRDAARSMPIAT